MSEPRLFYVHENALYAITLILVGAQPTAAADVAENYMKNCAVCHLPGIAGAPKVGEKADWAQRLRAALAKVPQVDLPNTKIEAEQGVIAIVGIVEHAEVARQAQDLVKRIPGVKKIDNRLISGHQMGWD